MNSKWLTGCPEHQKQERIDVVTNSRALLGLLAKVLEHELIQLGKATSVQDYDSPGWALKEADRKGQIRAIQNILSLCDNRTEGQT